MSKSLRCEIKHLCHNGTLTERKRDRILKALEHEDVLDKIRAEIENKENELGCKTSEDVAMKTAYIQVLKIIDKYRAESVMQNDESDN